VPEQPNGTAEPDTAIPGAPLPGQRTDPETDALDPGSDPIADLAPEAELDPAPAGPPPPVADPAPAPADAPRRWSGRALLLLATAAAALIAATAWHLGTVFLSIAPSNTASQRYQAQINAHVYPEFEQNWQLFAPNPLQDNIALQVQLQTASPTGTRGQSGWIGLTSQDVAHIRGNPVPSHVDQNLLRRAWDYYTSWHGQQDENSLGNGGPLSQEYLKRIALQRLGRDWHGSPIILLRFRAATTPVTGPSWTGAQQKPQTGYRTLSWWPVADDDYTGLL
jgi:hypothetical protein